MIETATVAAFALATFGSAAAKRNNPSCVSLPKVITTTVAITCIFEEGHFTFRQYGPHFKNDHIIYSLK